LDRRDRRRRTRRARGSCLLFLLLSVPARKEANQAVQHLRQLVAGHVREHLLAGARLDPAPAADEDVNAVDDLAVHLHLAALQAHVGRVVVTARGRAARPAHRQRARGLDAALELARERERPRLRADPREVAEVGAGARDQSALDLGGVVRKLPEQRLTRQLAQERVRDVRDEHVLRWRQPKLALTVALGDPRQLDELVSPHPADGRLEAAVVQAGLSLAKDADMIIWPGGPGVAPGGRQRASQARRELLTEPQTTPLVHQEGQARLAPRLARPVIAEDQRDRGAYLRGLLRRHEGVERGREARTARALLAADGDVEPGDLPPVPGGDGGRHRNVLGLPGRAVLDAAGDRDVELAGQVRERLVAEEDLLERRGDRRRVEELARRQAGGRAADDAADVVHAGLKAREPSRFGLRDDVRYLLDRHPSELDLLARRHVGNVPPRRLRDLAEQARLRRGENAVGHPDAHHEVAGRRLALEHADPLQPLLGVVRDGAPAFAGEAHEILGDVEAVALRLERLDLVHRLDPVSTGAWATRRSRTAHAFSSG